MEIQKIEYPTAEDYHNKELMEHTNEGIKTICGTVFLKAGTRLPKEGFTKSPFNEVSIITKGSIQMLDEEQNIIALLGTGSVVYFDALEPQAGIAQEDTQIIYVLNQKLDSSVRKKL